MVKKQVNVITPNPPICINIIMTNCPKEVKVVATSNGTKPVAQTALVDTNKAFTPEIPSTVQRGSTNKPVPIQYTEICLRSFRNNKAMFIDDTANQGQGCQKRDSLYPTQHFLQVRLYPFVPV